MSKETLIKELTIDLRTDIDANLSQYATDWYEDIRRQVLKDEQRLDAKALIDYLKSEIALCDHDLNRALDQQEYAKAAKAATRQHCLEDILDLVER